MLHPTQFVMMSYHIDLGSSLSLFSIFSTMHVYFISALVEHDCLAAQEDVTVNFAELGKLLGVFKWPT